MKCLEMLSTAARAKKYTNLVKDTQFLAVKKATIKSKENDDENLRKSETRLVRSFNRFSHKKGLRVMLFLNWSKTLEGFKKLL